MIYVIHSAELQSRLAQYCDNGFKECRLSEDAFQSLDEEH